MIFSYRGRPGKPAGPHALTHSPTSSSAQTPTPYPWLCTPFLVLHSRQGQLTHHTPTTSAACFSSAAYDPKFPYKHRHLLFMTTPPSHPRGNIVLNMVFAVMCRVWKIQLNFRRTHKTVKGKIQE